jgi:uncharacterized lipoprotein YmbA
MDAETMTALTRRGPAAPGIPLTFLIVLQLAGGCVGRSDPARFHVLAGVPHSSATTPSAERGPGPEIGVGPVTLPRYLERANIVTRRGTELEVAEFDRWGEPLSESVPRAIAANLATLLRTERVVVFPWPNATTIERQAVIDVIRFDGQLGGDVVLEARWRILGLQKKELVLRYSLLTEATGESGYPALVAAMSRSLAALSREIADAVKALPAPRAETGPGAGMHGPAGPEGSAGSARSTRGRGFP